MTAYSWLILANAALWLGLGFYIARLASAQHSLMRRMKQLEDFHE